MPESNHIAQKAAKLASEVFPTFYWNEIKPYDQNWECVNQEEHKRTVSKTHPSDAVFRYLHPYTGKQTYIIFDYKSLADVSIKAGNMGDATRQLALTLDCAMLSEEWQNLYLKDDDHDLQGCLFVYNHDNQYKRDLSKQIYSNLNNNFMDTWPKLQKCHEINIIDPHTIVFLYSLYKDLLFSEAKKEIPSVEFRGFYQPDKQIQYQKLAHSEHYKVPLLLDHLTSETIIIRYDINKVSNQPYESGKEGFIVYYRDSGENVDEFIYLIDSLFTYQIIDRAAKIDVKIYLPHKNAFPNLDKAKYEYSMMVSSSESIAEFIRKRLEVVDISSIDRTVPSFFETELGMV